MVINSTLLNCNNEQVNGIKSYVLIGNEQQFGT